MTEQLKASRQGVTPLSHATQVVVTHKDVQLLQECHPDVKVAQWNIYKKQRSSRQVCDKKYKCLLCDSSWLRSTAEVAKHMDANHAHTAPVTTSLPTYGGGAPAPAQELEHTNGTAAAQPTAQFLGADAASAAATATAAQPAAQSTAQFPGADAASAAATATAAQPTAPPPCLGGAVLTGYAAAASIALPSSQGGAPAIPTSPSPSLGAFATAFATAASSHGTVVIPAAVSASPPSLQATAAATASTPVATHAASLNATSSHSLPEDTDTPGAGTGRTGGRGRLVREPHAHDLSPAGQESAHHNGSGGGGGGGVEDGSLAGSSAHGPGSSPDAPGMLASKVQAAPAGSECKVVSGKPGADAGAGGGVGGTHARQRRHGASGRRGGAGRRPRKPTRIARFSGKAHPPDTGVQVEEENEHGANNLTLNSDDEEEEEDRRSDDAGGGQQGECGADFKANFLHLPAPAAMDPIIITQTPAPTRVPTSAPLPQPGSALVHIKYDPLTSHQPAAPTPPPPPASGSPATPPSPTKAAPALQASPLAAPPPAAPPATTAAPTAPHAKATPVLQNAPPPPQRGMLSDACEGTSQQVACPSSVAGKQLCPTAPTAPPAPTTSGRHHNRDGHGDPETVLLNTAVGAVTNSDGHMKSRPEGCAEGAQVPKSLVSLPSQSSKGPPNHDSPSKRPCHLHLSPQRRQRREAYAGHSQQASQPVAVSSPNWGSAPRLQDHSLHAHTEAAAGLAGGGESERLEAGVWGASSVDTPRAGTAADAGADAGATGRESTPKASAGCAGTQAATENILSLLPLPKHPDDGALHPLQRACINNGSSCPLPKLSGSKRERAGASTGDDDDNDDGMPSPKQAKNVVQGRQFLDQMHPSVRDLESELTRAGAGVPGWPHALKLGETNTEGERQLAVLDTAAGAVKWLAGELVEAKKAQGELQLVRSCVCGWMAASAGSNYTHQWLCIVMSYGNGTRVDGPPSEGLLLVCASAHYWQGSVCACTECSVRACCGQAGANTLSATWLVLPSSSTQPAPAVITCIPRA